MTRGSRYLLLLGFLAGCAPAVPTPTPSTPVVEGDPWTMVRSGACGLQGEIPAPPKKEVQTETSYHERYDATAHGVRYVVDCEVVPTSVPVTTKQMVEAVVEFHRLEDGAVLRDEETRFFGRTGRTLEQKSKDGVTHVFRIATTEHAVYSIQVTIPDGASEAAGPSVERFAGSFRLVGEPTGQATPEQPEPPMSPEAAAKLKSQTHDWFCSASVRKCIAIPSDEACTALFEEVWPTCSRGVVVHDGPDPRDREAGRRVGGCITRALIARFGMTGAAGCP